MGPRWQRVDQIATLLTFLLYSWHASFIVFIALVFSHLSGRRWCGKSPTYVPRFRLRPSHASLTFQYYGAPRSVSTSSTTSASIVAFQFTTSRLPTHGVSGEIEYHRTTSSDLVKSEHETGKMKAIKPNHHEPNVFVKLKVVTEQNNDKILQPLKIHAVHKQI